MLAVSRCIVLTLPHMCCVCVVCCVCCVTSCIVCWRRIRSPMYRRRVNRTSSCSLDYKAAVRPPHAPSMRTIIREKDGKCSSCVEYVECVVVECFAAFVVRVHRAVR